MMPAYVYAPPYEANVSPVLVWNAYAPSFHPNAQIDLCSFPLHYGGMTIHDRAMFYWHGIYTGEVVPTFNDDLLSFEVGK